MPCVLQIRIPQFNALRTPLITSPIPIAIACAVPAEVACPLVLNLHSPTFVTSASSFTSPAHPHLLHPTRSKTYLSFSHYSTDPFQPYSRHSVPQVTATDSHLGCANHCSRNAIWRPPYVDWISRLDGLRWNMLVVCLVTRWRWVSYSRAIESSLL